MERTLTKATEMRDTGRGSSTVVFLIPQPATRNATRTARAWRRVLFMLLTGSGLLAIVHPAYADPHAVFYTDRGQEQLFYNVLAALNQADYVEPPVLNARPPGDHPTIKADQRLGTFIQTGNYTPPPERHIVSRTSGGRIIVTPPLEPLERESLPRIRVRAVTSDDGDVYYRERLERRARAEETRVLLGYIACRAATQIFGPEIAETGRNCPESALGSVF